MASEVNGVNVSADNVFVCIKITSWVRATRPHQVTAPTTLKMPPLWTSRPSLEKILDPPLGGGILQRRVGVSYSGGWGYPTAAGEDILQRRVGVSYSGG